LRLFVCCCCCNFSFWRRIWNLSNQSNVCYLSWRVSTVYIEICFVQTPEPVTVDSDNLSFKSKFKEKIEEYTQNWQIANIRIDSKRTCIKGEQNDSDLQNDVTNSGDNKSEQRDIMLGDIPSITTNDITEKVDILIYDKFAL
jgi:hypothetical protein